MKWTLNEREDYITKNDLNFIFIFHHIFFTIVLLEMTTAGKDDKLVKLIFGYLRKAFTDINLILFAQKIATVNK